MKIIFLETTQNFGGARKSTVELAKRLSEVHQVEIVDVYGSCKMFINYIVKNKIEYKIVDKRDSAFIIGKHKYKVLNIRRLFVFIFHWFYINLKTKSIMDSINPDVIIVNNTKTLSFLSFTTNVEKWFYARGWYLPQQISKLDKFLYSRFVDKFITVSQATRHALFSGGIAKFENIEVIQNPINLTESTTEKAVSPKNKYDFNIIVSGGFLETKGQFIAVQVVKVLLERNYTVKMLLAGTVGKDKVSQLYFRKIAEYIKNNDLKQNVVILKDSPDILSNIKEADYMLFPTTTEGLSRSILEALYLNTLVITHPVGGNIDMIQNNVTGLFADFNNVESFVELFEFCYANPKKVNEMKIRGRELVALNYTEEIQMKQFNKLISRIDGIS